MALDHPVVLETTMNALGNTILAKIKFTIVANATVIVFL
jgi:hypothetical protein